MSGRDQLLQSKEADAKELVRRIRGLVDKIKSSLFRKEDPEGWAEALKERDVLEKALRGVRQEIRDLLGVEELLRKSAEMDKKRDQANRERRLFGTEERRLYELDHYLHKRGWGKIYKNGEGLLMVYDGTSWANRPVSVITFAMKEGTNSSFVYARINTDEKEDETCCEVLRRFPFVGLVCAYRFSGERTLSSVTTYTLNLLDEPQGKQQRVTDTEMRAFLPRTVVSSVDIKLEQKQGNNI